MNQRNSMVAVAILIGFLYLSTIAIGLRIKDLHQPWPRSPHSSSAWTPPSHHAIPSGAMGDSIRFGESLFTETPLYAPRFAGAKISCANCHAEGGIQPYASPMIGLPPLFPMFNARAGHVISLKDRIQECFVRSENGVPLDYNGSEMTALVNYISWLSQPHPTQRPYVGRGLVELADLKPDPVRGAEIYTAQCAGCHGQDGNGKRPQFPALWGPNSFNDGAGMHGIKKMAAFVQHNMPQNRMGILSPQDAYDVSAFVHEQPRPAFNKAYAHY